MLHFQTYDLILWLHFACLAIAGGAAVAALLISGLEDEREEMRGLAPALWKKVVAWGFRLAALTGITLIGISSMSGSNPFLEKYLFWKLPMVFLLLAMAEMAPKGLAHAKRGAALLALLLFLLASFTVINRNAFGVRQRPEAPPPSLSPAP